MTAGARKQTASADALPEYRNNPELALVALICLMSRFPAQRSSAIATAIIVHLRLINEDVRLSHEIRDCAGSLIDEWGDYAILCAPGTADVQQHLPS